MIYRLWVTFAMFNVFGNSPFTLSLKQIARSLVNKFCKHLIHLVFILSTPVLEIVSSDLIILTISKIANILGSLLCVASSVVCHILLWRKSSHSLPTGKGRNLRPGEVILPGEPLPKG